MREIYDSDYFNYSDLGIIISDKDNKIQYLNAVSMELFKDIKGQDLQDYLESNHLIFERKKFWIALQKNNHFFLMREILDQNLNENKVFLIFRISQLLNSIPKIPLYDYTQKEIKSILDCIDDGIYVTDGNANTIMLNKVSEEQGSLKMDELIGRNMRDLVKEGYINESICLKVMEKKKEISIVQNVENQYELLVTGIPYYENGEITKIVSTERDITELIKLKKQLEESTELTQKYQRELEYYRSQNSVVEDIIYKSKVMADLVELTLRVAKQDTTVLIQGESGTGKEVFAKLIYKNSIRSNGSFIKINCGAIPENLIESELFGYEKGAFTGASDKGKVGFFELANKGTLFLDEVSELPLHLQVKILRAIQEREIIRVGGCKYIPIDVRIIAATNRDLKKAVEENTFRKDLFYRLNVVPIFLHPLRNRKEDIRPLGEYFLNIFNKKYTTNKKIEGKVWDLLYKYNWPGNIRELENIIERIIVTNDEDVITPQHVIKHFSALDIFEVDYYSEDNSFKQQVAKFENKLLLSKMPYYNSTQELADALGLDKSTVTRKMKRYNIKNIYID